jgi:transposase
MRKIREILRLKWDLKCSNHLIACSVNVSSSTVSDCVRRASLANLSWPLPLEMDDDRLIGLLYPPNKPLTPEKSGDIDWAYIHQELKRKHVTLMLLWQEYKAAYPNGFRYSWFCQRYREWREQLDVWMRQTHKLGEKCFVDYAGITMPVVIDRETGEIHECQIFVGCLGASNFTFCEASWSQSLPDWISAHVHMFEFFGGVPEIIVPDNLKSGVLKPDRYEPDTNPTYQDMASHYGIAIIPAHVASPNHKPKVENAVQQVERYILARLRNKVFFSLAELNDEIRILLHELNQKAFQKLEGSRQSQFLEFEKATLKPLPATRYVYAEWKKVRAGADYHVTIDHHHYSVPYTYTKKELEARYTQNTVEIFYKNKRIASHARSHYKHKHTTQLEHMPKAHRQYAEWTPERIINWAKKTGIFTAQLVGMIMESRLHPQQGFRSCLGILRLAKSYGSDRLESACKRAFQIGAHSYKSVESILKKKLDQQTLPETENKQVSVIPSEHEYIRGKNYFN